MRYTPQRPRSQHAIAADRAPPVPRVTGRSLGAHDLYHNLLIMRWSSFMAVLAAGYLAFNLAFAALYLLEPGAIANAKPGSFADAFFFSVQTMATIGYGDMHPQTLYANLLVTVEVLLAMMALALATGLVFARFSLPTARIMFSCVAVIAPYDGKPTLMFRAANQRKNRILEAQVTAAILREEASAEGLRMRRFHDLALTRARTPMFALTWTVMHIIDETSPLWGATRESLAEEQAEIVVTIFGLDETVSQQIHARYSYPAEDIVWNRRFVDILSLEKDGTRVVDYHRFHDVEELAGRELDERSPRAFAGPTPGEGGAHGQQAG
jgi:inward rectifier potassium channel